MYNDLWSALLIIIQPFNFIGLLGGFFLGVVFGAIPGLSSITAVILVLPFTYGMGPYLTFLILVSAYCGAMYAGSIPAVLFKTPGTSSALMTVLDGYPLAQQGRGGEALGISAVSSSIGGILSGIVLILLTPVLSQFALSFGPGEFFAAALFGMSAVTSLGRGKQAKAFISLFFGIIVASVGADAFRGMPRFTFGQTELLTGFQLVPVLAGIFAMSEVFNQVEKAKGAQAFVQNVSSALPNLRDIVRMRWTYLRASLIGIIVGIIPGAGATIASTIAYNEEQRWSKQPEKFGTGMIEGVAAAESSNNAAAGGALIPTMALGIPGSPTAAALIGAFWIQGLNPGPTLYVTQPALIATIFLAVMLTSILILVIGVFGVKPLTKLLEVRYKYIAPVIVLFSIWGTYSVRNNPWDIWVTIIFGIVGYLMLKLDFSLVPFTLGFILGPFTEQNLLYSMKLYDNTFISLLTRPVSLCLIVLSVFALIYPFIHIEKPMKATT